MIWNAWEGRCLEKRGKVKNMVVAKWLKKNTKKEKNNLIRKCLQTEHGLGGSLKRWAKMMVLSSSRQAPKLMAFRSFSPVAVGQKLSLKIDDQMILESHDQWNQQKMGHHFDGTKILGMDAPLRHKYPMGPMDLSQGQVDSDRSRFVTSRSIGGAVVGIRDWPWQLWMQLLNILLEDLHLDSSTYIYGWFRVDDSSFRHRIWFWLIVIAAFRVIMVIMYYCTRLV